MGTTKSAKCKICGKKYVSKQALIDHIDKTHSANIPEGWNAARYENFLRTGKTEGHCVYCKTETGWNDATGKYNRMCGSEKCKKIAREKANKNYIGLHGKPYSINNPEQQKKMVYGRKNSGKYIFEGEDGKEYVAMYDSSYGRDFFEMIDTLLSWDGADIIAPSPHTYWYEYEGKKHFYIPDAYSTSLNLEIEIKDGGDNPNNHPKIQAVDKIKEQKKDEVMESLKGQVNYIKICNKDYTGFFAMLSELRQKDNCPLPKWESRLESITEAYLPDEADKGSCFSWYHLEEEKKKYPGGWDDEQYFEDLNSAIRQVLSSVSLKERKGEVLRYVYTLGKDCGAVLLGAIVIKWYDYWDHVSPRYDFYWDYQEEVNLNDIDQERNPVQESTGAKKGGPGMILSEGFLRRQYKLRHPMLNYDSLMDYYRKKLFHENLDVAKWQTLYAELINVREYLKKVVNGNSEEDKRLNYEAKKALKQVESFIKYMEEKNATNPITESSKNISENSIEIFSIDDPNVERYILQSNTMRKYFNVLKSYCRGETIVDKSKGKLIGFVFVGHKEDAGFISNLWVSNSYRKQGYGSKLLDDAINKYGGTDLTVKKDNKVAINMYKNRGFVMIDFNDPRYDKYYLMKLRSKLSKDDKVITESKDIFEEGDFSEYRKYADLDSARGPITESLLKTPKTVFDYSRIANLINDKTVEDEKEPVGNQNCQLCTWCFEARIRGIDILPRPVYSPRDIIFSYNGYDIVKNPIQIKIKDKNDVVDTLLKSGDGSRYYVHVNWRGSSGGHEFLLTNIDGKIYVLDGQAGLVSDINSIKGSAYFKNINFANSFIVRLDDKDFNKDLLKFNDDSYIVEWDDNDANLLGIAESTFESYTNSMGGENDIETKSTSQTFIDNKFQEIVDFNVRLNNYEYIIPASGKLNVTSEDFMNYYKVLTPKEFEKYKGGICWDYVAYEADYFKRKFPSVKFTAYYVISINGTTQPTHTFIIFKYGGYVYWFESSWKLMHGIYKFKTESDALNYICKHLRDSVDNYKEQYITTYDPLDKQLFGMGCIEYMEYMEKRLPKKPIGGINRAINPIEVITQPLSYDETTESTSIEATKDDAPYYPVFIFLSYTGTNMAKLIKAFTHDPYAHSSLSFDTDLNHMISFNRDGMVDESIFTGIYKKNAANIRYSLYAYMATADEYEAMKNFIGELLGKRGKLKYNLLGLTNFIFGRGSEREDKFFCSEFVASVISAGNSKVFQRKPYMTSPYMLAKNKNFVFIKTGILKNYDSKVIDKIVAEKLEEGGFTNVIIK